MATKVYDEVELELQNGDVVTVRPLNIKQLRRFMEEMGKLTDADASEEKNLDVMVDACAIALSKALPNLASNREALEEALDIPTIWKILEVAGGIKMNDPNLPAGMAPVGQI